MVKGNDEIGVRGSTSLSDFIVTPGAPGGSSGPPACTQPASVAASTSDTAMAMDHPALFEIDATGHLRTASAVVYKLTRPRWP